MCIQAIGGCWMLTLAGWVFTLNCRCGLVASTGWIEPVMKFFTG